MGKAKYGERNFREKLWLYTSIDSFQENTGQKKSWLVVSSQDSFRLYLVSYGCYSLGMVNGFVINGLG